MQRTLIVAAASALLLAAAVTELSSRLWPGNYFALLVLAFIALLVNGLFNIRQLGAPSLFAALGAAATPAAASPQQQAQPTRNTDGRGATDGPREEGTVKWFNRSKGFGFIVRSTDEEIFVHQRSIRNEDGRGRPALRDGEKVSFVVTHRERGQQAEDVVPVDPA